MKNIIWALVVIVLGVGMIMTSRYELKIDMPVVAKLDHLTGDLWIVNGGVWRKVQNMTPENTIQATVIAGPAEQESEKKQ